MLHDEATYPDADSFRPERWLSASSDAKLDVLDVTFGFGRRWAPYDTNVITSDCRTLAYVLGDSLPKSSCSPSL